MGGVALIGVEAAQSVQRAGHSFRDPVCLMTKDTTFWRVRTYREKVLDKQNRGRSDCDVSP